MSDPPIRFTEHARRQADRRQLDLDRALEAVRSPQQVVPVREFRQVLTDGGRAVLRVLVDLTDGEVVVVTMYRTTRVDKYWRRP